MIIRCYENGDRRIHVDRNDDESFISASILTNPAKGFRKFISKINSESELNSLLAAGYVKTFEKKL